ncbi:SurA N-terminal domain-containing protein [Aquincola sp. MAHUQ-54]|uniref:Periplasmic chaperone PpiD n=1 Tax=Aquincola agrisoli TaxID=3119538 RepID=A0AAW9Q8I7_9BURK
MFEFVRNNTRLLQGILVVLIFPAFVVASCQGYEQFMGGGNATVAKVDGHTITQAEWDAAHQRQAERVRQQMPNVDPKLFDTPEARHGSLDQLVRERVMFAAVNKLHLAVPDERLQRELLAVPQLAALRRPDGSMDLDAYKALLAAQGMSPAMFEASVRQDAALKQVFAGVEGSAFAPASVARASLDPLLQRRMVQLQRFDARSYAAKVQPSDAEIEAYYQSHADQFRAPEQASIEYVVLNVDALLGGQGIPEEELRKYYDENIARYTSAEERRASHILVKADKDAPAAEREKAKAKAEALLAEVRKAPATFAEVARKNSDDPGSAEQGGDLDFFSRGAMVKPFEDAAYAMKPGEISNLVESDFGYHIIRLDAVRGGDKKPFAAVRPEIEAEVKKQLAQRRYAEAAEQFSNTVYEQADSLQPVIDKLKLTKQTAVVQRTPAPGATGALASQKLLEAVFSTDATQGKRNTDAVEIGPNQLAAARVVEYTPARVVPLAEVKPQVRERVVQEQAAALARKEGEARLAAVRESADGAGLPAATEVSRAQSQALPRAVLDAVLRADAGKLPAVVGVDVPGEGYVVARITEVRAPDEKAPELVQLLPRYAQAWGTAESAAYYDALKSRFKVELKGAGLPAPADAASAVDK